MLRTNEELYRLMKAGERDAFASLYDRLEPGLYRYVLHMTASPSAAEEIAHEVFVQLMTASARFDENRGCLEAWVYGVARNLVRAFRRKGPVEQPVDQAMTDDIVGDLIHDETMAALRTAIAELPDGYRDAVVLCDLEERNYDEAARLMGCPIGTVRSRLHRARGLLAGKLKRLRPVMEMSAR
ncbi:MAG: sigma-70 family RNA polymerase sigma factor [Acidobacteriota bacterium]|nr:sigma-70 family RNA polymerase sigma factor [Acidobacteriota bacterium]